MKAMKNIFTELALENKNIVVRFSIGDPPPSPPSKKKQVALEKSLRLHKRGSPAATAEAV